MWSGDIKRLKHVVVVFDASCVIYKDKDTTLMTI